MWIICLTGKGEAQWVVNARSWKQAYRYLRSYLHNSGVEDVPKISELEIIPVLEGGVVVVGSRILI